MATELKKWKNPRTGEIRVYVNNREVLGYTKVWFEKKSCLYQLKEIRNIYGQVDEFQLEEDDKKAIEALSEINPDMGFWSYENALSLAI